MTRHVSPEGLPTLGHYRHDHGIRMFVAYCTNGVNCWHRETLTLEDLPDETVLYTLGRRMVCSKCGHKGADVRPVFPTWKPPV